jgi:hypothetical protein
MGLQSAPMKDSIYDFVMGELAKTELTYAQVAKGSKVPKRTLEKIARHEIKNPGVRHIERLAAYFRAHSNPARSRTGVTHG